jgi:cystathionine beta-lyase
MGIETYSTRNTLSRKCTLLSLVTYICQSVTIFAPTKTFNLSGLQSAYAVIPDPKLLKEYHSLYVKSGFFVGPIFNELALEAAYTKGAPWVDQLVKCTSLFYTKITNT